MQKDIQVIVVEDDPYARDFMSMLLRRDWRTRVVGELGINGIELHHALRQTSAHVNVIIVDTEVPDDELWPLKVAQSVQSLAQPPAMLYTCTYPERRVLSHVLEAHGSGYVAKGEILYGLASAVAAVAAGKFVITPSVQMLAGSLELPESTVVMDGTVPVASFTPREIDLTRLGLLFNLGQRDIADDLVVSTDFVAEVMSQVYEKLGLHEMLAGEKAPEAYFRDEKLLAHCRQMLEQAAGGQTGKPLRKAPWMSTIAFHLLTVPEIEELG
jgi:DNA-binding NarL/FixJ family response regulator